MPTREQVRTFSSLLPDIASLHVVSRLQRTKGPTPEELTERARQDAVTRGKAEGYAAGFAEGRAQGHVRGRKDAFDQAHEEATAKFNAELSELFSMLASHVADVNSQIPGWFEDAETAMTERTMTILKRLLAAELSLGRDHALAIVEECLEEVTHSNHVRVRMNPFDSIVVSQHRDKLMALAPQLRDIVFVDDPSIEGGCILESDAGLIDATLDTRLALIDGDLAA